MSQSPGTTVPEFGDRALAISRSNRVRERKEEELKHWCRSAWLLLPRSIVVEPIRNEEHSAVCPGLKKGQTIRVSILSEYK